MNQELTTNIKCNNYTNGLTNQPGDQPIRIFYEMIEHEFEIIKKSINNLKCPVENVKLEYLTENTKVIGPSTNGKKITIHETYLSFLWGYIYSINTIAPIGDKIISIEENLDARKLIKYIHGLMFEYNNWDINILPNPVLFSKDDNNLIDRANYLFLLSIRFILLHEFAHIFLGHLNISSEKRTEKILKQMENDADITAINWSFQTYEEDEKFMGKLSILLALNSLSYSKYKFNDTKNHPAPEERITMFLEYLNIEDLDYLWGVAIYSIMEWQTYHELFYLPFDYKSGDSFKLHYYKMIGELKNYKETGINNFKG